MKKIISILIMLSALSLYAYERGADRAEMNTENKEVSVELKALKANRKEHSAANKNRYAHYIPAIQKSTLRNPKDPRFAKSIKAQGDSKSKTNKEIANEIFAEALESNPNLAIAKTAKRHTYIWYKLQELEELENIDKAEKLKEISEMLK